MAETTEDKTSSSGSELALDQRDQAGTRLFLERNRQEFAELLTFIDFAQGLTIGFVEVNQEQNKALLVSALKEALSDTESCLEVINFSREQNLRRLKDAIVQRLGRRLERVEIDKKLVVVVQGLEAAIGTDGVGAYPPVLQDLNFIRDAYRQDVPHPLLFVLPDYAITRVSKYAPDFYSWCSGMFRFKTVRETVERLKVDTLEQPSSRVASDDNQAQIEQLKRLLMEINPSGKQMSSKDVALCSQIYYKIGSAYLTQQRPEKARDYLQEAIKLMELDAESDLSQSLYHKLGNAYEQMREYEKAISVYETALATAQSQDRTETVAFLLHNLGNVAIEQRRFEQAEAFYQQAIDLYEAGDNRYSQAGTYHQLGMVAQEQREYEQARAHYQQALDIKVEYGNRYSQASAYDQLGLLAEAEENYARAQKHLQQALEVFVEFGDEYSVEIVISSLARIYEETQNHSLLANVAQCLNSTVEEVTQRFDELNSDDSA